MDDKQLAKTSSQVTKWDRPMNLLGLSVNEMRFLGQTMADSGMFPDLAKDAAKAMVKIAAGQEIGVPPFQAMTGINIIQGKAAMGANLMASKLKGSSKYDYRAKASSDSCTITISQKEGGKFVEIGSYTFTMKDAQAAGLSGKDNWKKYPANMLFARAISNAVRLYAPDVFNGVLVYDPDELEGAVTPDGQTLDMTESESELAKAQAKIAAVKDEDELTNLVMELPADIQAKVTQQATDKFKELTNADADEATTEA